MSETLTIDAPGAASSGPAQPPAINPPLRRFAAAVRDCFRGFPGWAHYQMAGPATIVVLGMHRSGTSCITRMVNLCGASLGDSTIGANEYNKSGHWEAAQGLEINELILRYSGGTWDNPPERLLCAGFIRWKMREFLGRLHREGTAVWKDPRTVVTFPLWRPMLKRCMILAAYRHPLSVARSLQRRDGFDLERGLELWRNYNARLVSIASHEKSVYWLDFDGGPEHTARVLGQLASDAGLKFGPDVMDAYEPDLRTSDLRERIADETIRTLYDTLRRKSGLST
jgi:hypothetical protein